MYVNISLRWVYLSFQFIDQEMSLIGYMLFLNLMILTVLQKYKQYIIIRITSKQRKFATTMSIYKNTYQEMLTHTILYKNKYNQ